MKCKLCGIDDGMVTAYYQPVPIGGDIPEEKDLVIHGYVHLPPGCGRSWPIEVKR